MRIVDSASATRAARTVDEDALLLTEQPSLLAVADGMGGPGIGDRAAKLAVEALARKSPVLERLAKATESDRASGARLALGRTLERLFSDIHGEVLEAAQQASEPSMGTTLLAAVVCGGYATLAHIGASRAYLLRDGQLRQLTEDHTLGMLRHKQGLLPVSELQTSPLRDRLYQALGTGADIDVDVASVGLADQDVLMLCSDGVHRFLDETALVTCLSRGDAATIASSLLEAASTAGSTDDRTAVVVKIAAEASAADLDSVARVLANTSMFADLSSSERLLVAPYLDPVVLDRGEVLFEEGAVADAFYVIVAGKLRVMRAGTPLTEIGPGGGLGELCLGGPLITRTASAVVIEPLSALGLTRERFLEVVARKPSIGTRLLTRALSLVGERLRDLTDRLAQVEQLAVGELKPGDLALRTAIVLAARGEWSR
jgi:serine/threonine protein phosphatase PrpC